MDPIECAQWRIRRHSVSQQSEVCHSPPARSSAHKQHPTGLTGSQQTERHKKKVPTYLGEEFKLCFDQLLAQGKVVRNVLAVRLCVDPIVDEHQLSHLASEAGVHLEGDPV